MEYRKLGRTGLDVSLLCLGTMTWGRQNSEEEGHAQMDYAIGQGINFFDTAEMYAVPPTADTYGKTEEIIGSWFACRGSREKVILASKVAGPALSWVRGGNARLDRKNMIAAVEGSLKRLRTDYIDLYQLHWPNRPSYHFGQHWNHNTKGIIPAEEKDGFYEILETFDDLIKAGKVCYAGLSNETSWGTMNYVRLAEEKNLPRVVSIQNEYSLMCRLFEPDMAEIAIHEDVGLLAYSPLVAGAISGKYLEGQVPEGSRRSIETRKLHRDTPQADLAIKAYMDVAAKHGLDVCQMALAFVNSRPFVTSNIIGATTMAQLKTNIASIDIKLGAEVLADIDSVYRRYTQPF